MRQIVGFPRIDPDVEKEFPSQAAVRDKFPLQGPDGSLPQVLASYNAGENRVERWENRYLQDDEIEIFMELIPIDQTRKYVKYILYYYYVYQWFYRLEEGICWYKPIEYQKAQQN